MVGAASLLVLAGTACGSDSGSSSSGSGSDSDDLCAFAEEMERTFNDESFGNADQATFEQIEEIMTNVQDRAPDEIKADVETVASTFKDVQEIFAENDYDLTKVAAAAASDADLTARLQAVNGPEFSAASDRVNTYLEETCGIQGTS